MLPAQLFIQENKGTLFVNRTAEGAAGHHRGPARVGIYQLVKEVIVSQNVSVKVEDVPPSEIAAEAPQN